jgi:hypothetical protein
VLFYICKKLLDLSRPFLQKESGLRRNWWETYTRSMAESIPLTLVTYGFLFWDRLMGSNAPTKKSWKYSLHKLADKKDILGRTPLIYAAQLGDEVVVWLLLKRGADVEAKDKERERTALIYAARSGHG